MSELPPVPEEFNRPDVDLRRMDLRAHVFSDHVDMFRTVIRNMDAQLETRGWDAPDWIGLIYRGDPCVEDSETAYLWIAELRMPAQVHGDMARFLPGLATALSLPSASLREAVLTKALGRRPAGSVPLGVVVSFEAYGIDSTVPMADDVVNVVLRGGLREHPAATEQRHVVARLSDGTVLYLIHERGREPFFANNPSTNLLGPLGLITDAICQQTVDGLN